MCVFDEVHDEYMHECVTVVMLKKHWEEDGGVFVKELHVCVHLYSYIKLVMWSVCRQTWYTGIKNMKRYQPFASLHSGY